MAICSHYVCGLLPNSVEVASLLEQKIVQSFPFAKGISLVADDKKVIVASESKVMTLFLTSILDQVKQYLSAGFVDEALALLNKTAPSTKSLHDFHAEAGFVCLKNMQFDASTKHFVASNVDPRDVVSVFPDLQLKDKPHKPIHYAVPKLSIDQIIEQQKKRLSASDDKNDKVLGNTPASELLIQARFNLTRFLWTRRTAPAHGLELVDADVRTAVDTALLVLYTDFATLRWKPSAKIIIPPPRDPTNTGASDDSKLALNFKSKDRDMKTITRDTAMWASAVTNLVQATLGASDSSGLHFPFALNDLLMPANHIHIAQAEQFLETRRQYNSLALLYQSKGAPMRKKALDIWLRMGSGEYKESGMSSTLWVGSSGAGGGASSVASPTSSGGGSGASSSTSTGTGEKADQSTKELELDLSGIRQTVSLLTAMNDDQLIYDFADWVLGANPKEGMKIFTSKVRAQPLNPDKVLEFLRRLKVKSGSSGKTSSASAAASAMDNDLVEQFLEHLLRDTDSPASTDTNYHNQLCKLYLKKVIILQPSPLDKKPAASTPADKKRGGGGGGGRVRPGEEPGLLGAVRRKLFDLLQSSTYYSVPAILEQARDTTLYEEMIVLHAKSNNYGEVLRTFIFRLNDHAGAINYCVRVATAARQAKLKAALTSALAKAAKARIDAANHVSSGVNTAAVSGGRSGRHSISSDMKSIPPGGAATGSGRSRASITGRGGNSDTVSSADADADDALSETDSLDSAGSAGSAGSGMRSGGIDIGAATNKPRSSGIVTTGGGGGGGGTAISGAASIAGPKKRKRTDIFLELLDIYLSDDYKRAHPLSADESDPKYYYQANSSDEDSGGDDDDGTGTGGSGSGGDDDDDPQAHEARKAKRAATAAAAATAEFNDSSSDTLSYRRRVVYVINSFSAWLDPIKVLKLIPADIPVHSIAGFLSASIPRTLARRRQGSIVKNLEKMHNLKTKTELIAARTQRFKIAKERRCVVCRNPISDSIFSVHPLAKVVDRPNAPALATLQDLEDDDTSNERTGAALVSGSGPPNNSGTAAAAAAADDAAADMEAFPQGFIPQPASREESGYVITHYRCNARYRRLCREQRKRMAAAGGAQYAVPSRPTLSGAPPAKARHQSTYG